VTYLSSDLDLFDFDSATLAFTNRRNLVKGNGQAIAFPSFSPDSAWIFYQRGDVSSSKYKKDGTTYSAHDGLFVSDVAGVVGELSLAIASGAGLDAKNQDLSYQPTVNPISVGGYSWVVFSSPRDYGNKMVSTNPGLENRKQLWVAAVDANPQQGKDPSHPAFWLGGQDLSTINMSGYWSLEPCKRTGASCDQGFECCGGYCFADSEGTPVCTEIPGDCAATGDACRSAADCCASGDTCIGGFCALAVPN